MERVDNMTWVHKIRNTPA